VALRLSPSRPCALCATPAAALWLQVKEMLMPFGQLKAFNLVMDRGTGNSKVTDAAAHGQGAGTWQGVGWVLASRLRAA
jgi:hypothetical protein